ncbi:MAG: nucleoside kinase [Prevotellaceae bacterium]|jgi:uridine kinase|nr:nucleoside kinase [Prevotellaceae bacterium]
MQKTVNIYYKPNSEYRRYPIGTTVLEILNDINPADKDLIVSAKVNGKSEDLNFAVYKPKDIEFVRLTSSSGMRVYVRTLCIVLSKALYDLFPKAQLFVEHPLSKGYYCSIKRLGRELTPEIIAAIKQRMDELIASNLPVIRHEEQYTRVVELFHKRKMYDKLALLESLQRPYNEYFELDGYIDYYNGALLPYTGMLRLFDLEPIYDGLLLRLPSGKNPTVLEEMVPQFKMYEIFKEHIEWNNIMGVSNVGEFNRACKARKSFDLIKIAEALHEKKIAGIADRIINDLDTLRFVMVSGPSSSGKTTFSKRLSIQLMAAGVKPIIVSLDNYFVDRDKTPRDKNGEYDYECIEALDIDFFNKQLTQLLAGEEVSLPSFNFETGKRMFRGKKARLGPRSIVLMEGIHALNPSLTPTLPEETKFKIYVSALTSIAFDNHNWIPTTDNRLLRRIIRDNRYRGYSAQETIARWASVRAGEDKWIFPFQENADVMFNSALIFELGILKKYADPILAEVPRNSDEFSEAHRLLKFLNYFASIPDREIPPTSLLREFLGGSSFKY